MKIMEQYKKLDKNKLLLSPSGGKQQTRVSYGPQQSNDFDDVMSEYPKTAKTNPMRQSTNESITSISRASRNESFS
jgi:hypothetical protein